MATSSPYNTPGTMPDAEPMAAEPAGDDAGQMICITVAADGSITVGLEDGGQDQGEATPAQDIADALKQALMLYRQISGSTQNQAQASFDGGFGKAPAAPSSAAARGMA